MDAARRHAVLTPRQDEAACRTVLVVDDEASVRRLAARDLRAEFDVVLAAGREEAIALLDRTEVFAVISDLSMSEADEGVALLTEVLHKAPRSLRILVSGSVELDAIERALQTGLAQGFVSKPWDAGALSVALRRLVEEGSPAGWQWPRQRERTAASKELP